MFHLVIHLKQKIFDQIIYQNIFYIQLLIDEAAKGKSHEQNEIDAKSTLIKFFNDLQKQLRGVKGGMRTRKYRSKSISKGTRRCLNHLISRLGCLFSEISIEWCSVLVLVLILDYLEQRLNIKKSKVRLTH